MGLLRAPVTPARLSQQVQPPMRRHKAAVGSLCRFHLPFVGEELVLVLVLLRLVSKRTGRVEVLLLLLSRLRRQSELVEAAVSLLLEAVLLLLGRVRRVGETSHLLLL